MNEIGSSISLITLEGDSNREHSQTSPSSLIGSTLMEKYEVLEVLGRGGVGAVYKVRHLQLDKLYALKVLQAENASNEAILRFKHEARVISNLVHHNIVGVVDFGVNSEAQPYMVMELVEGIPLSEMNRGELLPVERLARIFRQVCDALAYAHEEGIVHRDIKPANIIVNSKDGSDHVTVVDFGLAKNVAPEGDNSTHLTKTGDVFGTPAYMSPEQCLGKELDGRADLYSLGCVIYQAMAGHVPFSGDSVFEVVSKQISESPKPLARKGSREKSLEVITLRALAKSPQNRYRFALEMAADLKSVEVQESGLISDFAVAIKLTQGRVRAGSKGEAWWNSSAQIAILLAGFLVFTLTTTPKYLTRDCAQMERQSKILTILEETAGGANFKKDFWQSLQQLKKFKRDGRLLDPLVFQEPEEKMMVHHLERCIATALSATQEITDVGRRSRANNDFNMFWEAAKNLGTLVEGWADVSDTYAKFRAMAFKKCSERTEAVGNKLTLYWLYKWGGVVDLSALAILLAIRIRARNARKKNASS